MMRTDARHAGFLLAPPLCLLAPLFVFLVANRYPLLTAEVGILIGLATLPGIGSLFLAERSHPRGALSIVCICACFGLLVQYGLFLTPYWLLAALLIVVALLVIVGERSAFFVAVAAGAHLCSSIAVHMLAPTPGVDNPSPNVTATSSIENTDLPPIVHLMLDEFGGPPSIPVDIDGGPEFRESLTAFFARSGFTFFPNAYSQYFRTRNSVPNLFNFRAARQDKNGLSFRRGSLTRLVDNEYFKHLIDLGYRIDVYQTDYIDFCSTEGIEVGVCRTYPLIDVRSIRTAGISAWQRAAFLRKSLLDSSAGLRNLRLNYLKLRSRFPTLPNWRMGNGKTGPLSSVRAISDVEARIASLRPGEVVFAHLMTPHFPYVYQKDCSARPKVTDWLNRVPFEVADRFDDALSGLEAQNDLASRRLRYQKYIEQAICSQTILQGLFDVLREAGRWEQSIVLVHGDHGPRIFLRIPHHGNINELTDDDFRDAYSALFAIKSPELSSGVVQESLPLQVLLARGLGLPEPQIDPKAVYLLMPNSNELITTPVRGFDD